MKLGNRNLGKRDVVDGCVYKHPSMKTKFFNDEYLTPLLWKINKEWKIFLLMGDFNSNLLSSDRKPEVLKFFESLPTHFFILYILQQTRLAKNPKTLTDNIFVNNIEFGSCSENFTSQISYIFSNL